MLFQFTTSQGGRRISLQVSQLFLTFQFTTSQGGRLFPNPDPSVSGYFNSRPHKEVDFLTRILGQEDYISIHDLTRRSTHYIYNNVNHWNYFNSRPHKEVDHASFCIPDTGLLFQFTTSQGGRHLCCRLSNGPFIFQFTTSQGGRLRSVAFAIRPVLFQFTTSQGGRLFPNPDPSVSGYFNSRPHKEVDFLTRILGQEDYISIHDLTRRSTHYIYNNVNHWNYFNSRPHKEVDFNACPHESS